MGDYSTLLIVAEPRPKYLSFVRALGGDRSLELALLDKYKALAPTFNEFKLVNRWRFTLWGAPSYVPREWDCYEGRTGIQWDGTYVHLTSSKNDEPHRFFARRIAPIIFRPGYTLVVGDYR